MRLNRLNITEDRVQIKVNGDLMMNTEQMDLERTEENLMKCDEINQIMHSIYYSVCQLQKLNQLFEKDTELHLAAESFLALHSLLDIRQDKIEYLNQYQEVFSTAINHLSDFIFKLEHPETLAPEQKIRLARIIDELAYYQKEILSINW